MNAVVVGLPDFNGRTSGRVSHVYATAQKRTAAAPVATRSAREKDTSCIVDHPPTTIRIRSPGRGGVAGDDPFMIASVDAFTLVSAARRASESQVSLGLTV